MEAQSKKTEKERRAENVLYVMKNMTSGIHHARKSMKPK
jgi:hypothetical protein